MEENGAGLAFEKKGGRLTVSIEPPPHYVEIAGRRYFVDELPSVIVGGKKFCVEGIF
ncbi:MAG: hypothetical protein N3E51_00815 [Candidatus Micrarchaeota archaeon]|nr:hypothetical protein [Candidatus Micrarchaeota archaeon]